MIIHLIKVKDIPKLPRRECKAMTVGIGFQCSDGVILLADRQITSTGGFKYDARKISASHDKECNFIFSYAGYPDAGEVTFRRLRQAFAEKLPTAKGEFPLQRAMAILEEVFYHHDSEGLQTLIGVRMPNSPAVLFRTQDTKVVGGSPAECIGSGDSSALKYLTSFLTQKDRTIDEASVLGTYIVSVANRYIDGCSGGPDRAVIYGDGSISEGAGKVYDHQEERFLHCETVIGERLRELLISGGRE